MIGEFVRAFFIAGLPVGIVSFLLLWWGVRREYFDSLAGVDDLDREIKRMSKERKQAKKRKGETDDGFPVRVKKLNPIHNKWLTFGGGFYGVVALITFAVVEFWEIVGFMAELEENLSRFSQLNADILASLIVNSFQNFITAITWPLYWMDEIHGEFWIWFLTAYLGYWLGARFAIAGARRKPGSVSGAH